jgi:hypothetical protein
MPDIGQYKCLKSKTKMTGILAQTIALTSYGNEYLRSEKLSDFYPQTPPSSTLNL